MRSTLRCVNAFPHPDDDGARRPRPPHAVLVLYAVYLVASAVLFLGLDGPRVGGLQVRVWALLQDLGMPGWVSLELFEALANGAAFVPLVLVPVLLVRSGAWWVWAALGVGLSGGIEFAQFLLLDSRVPDLRDVVANGLGGALGAWLGTVCTRTRVA